VEPSWKGIWLKRSKTRRRGKIDDRKRMKRMNRRRKMKIRNRKRRRYDINLFTSSDSMIRKSSTSESH
jgi:hypothetical protein